ncbi:DinB family protein [Actinomadura luteofluorescens]
MDTAPLRDAYRALLDAAESAADADTVPPPGEWNVEQILAHVIVINAVTITAVSAVASGSIATYDNRLAQEPWTIERVIAQAGGGAVLQNRIALQADAVCSLGGSMLSDAELDVLVPTRLVSNGELLVDQPVPLRDLLGGLAGTELPGHTRQILDLAPNA